MMSDLKYTENFNKDLKQVLSSLLHQERPPLEIDELCDFYTSGVYVGVLKHDGVLNTAASLLTSRFMQFNNKNDRFAYFGKASHVLHSTLSETSERLLDHSKITADVWETARIKLMNPPANQ